jgi:WD40 repeat protein
MFRIDHSPTPQAAPTRASSRLLALAALVALLGPASTRPAAADEIKFTAILKHDDGLEGTFQSVAFSPDGARLAAAYNVVLGRSPEISGRAGQGGTVHGQVVVWDVSRRTKLKTLPRNGPVGHVAFSPDGKLLAAAFADKAGGQRVALVDTATWQDRHTLTVSDPGALVQSITALRFSPDGKKLVIAMTDLPRGCKLFFADPLTGKKGARQDGGAERISSLSFCSEGTLLTSASDDVVQVWDGATAKVRSSFGVRRCNLAAMSPDGKTVAVSTTGSRKYPGTVAFTLRDAGTGKELMDFKCLSHGTAVQFTPDGKRLVYGYGSGVLALYDPGTGQRTAAVDGPTFASLAVAPTGSLVATGNHSGTIWLWEIHRAR